MMKAHLAQLSGCPESRNGIHRLRCGRAMTTRKGIVTDISGQILKSGVVCLTICLALPTIVGAQLNEENRGERAPARNSRRTEPKRAPISLDGGESINPEVLANVQDDTLGLTSDDREAYYRILKLTEKLDPVDLRDMAREFREHRHSVSKYRELPLGKFPTFVDLFQHPDIYRGRPVTLHGKLRRLISYDAGENDLGLELLYEGWFFADDAQENPTVVILTEIPEGIPTGADIEEEAAVTGYFLKMYGYSAQDTTRRAPMILARTVSWRPNVPMQRWNPPPQTYLALTVAVGVIALLIAMLVRDSQAKRDALKRRLEAKYDEFTPLESDLRGGKSAEPGRNGTPVEPHH